MDTKQAALDLAPTAIAPTASPKPPEKFTYALPAFTVQRRKSGWWISPTSRGSGEKLQWTGPFATIETACLSSGRRLAIDIADRHTQSIERYELTPDDALYGLKPTTRLDAP
jgi:hypothetical protein